MIDTRQYVLVFTSLVSVLSSHYLYNVVSYTLKVSFNIISLNLLQQRRMSRFLKGRVQI